MNTNTRSLFLVACLMLGSAFSAHATVRALVIGIDEYPNPNQLTSCANDARGMADLLTKQFGVPKQNVRLLLNSDATATGIRKAFKEHLLDTTTPDDEVFFYFSGHGALSANWTATNGGRLMKVLVTYHTGRLFVTDYFTHAELKDLLGQLKTTKITLVLDCCHAGSMTKSLSLPGADEKIKAMDIGYGAAEKYLTEEPREEPQVYSKSAGANVPVLWLGACLSNQYSYCGTPMSRFTTVLLEQLQVNHNQTMTDVFPRIQAKVERQTRMIAKGVQTPIMEGPADRPLVIGTASTPPPVVTQPPLPPVVTQPPSPPIVTAPPPPPRLTPPSQQDFPLLVRIDRNQYTEGDMMKVQVTAGSDCYLRLYVMNAATEIQQLFPNQYATNNFIRKNEIIEIPSPDTFLLHMEKPFGTETLLAVGSLEQFTDLFKPSFSSGGFQDLGNMTPARMGTRGIGVIQAPRPGSNKPTNKISYSSVQYTVSPR